MTSKAITIRTMQDVLRALNGYVPQGRTLRQNYNLDRMQAFMAAIGSPQDQLRVVHVAGSSGKTSTCYFIRALLRQAGSKTGLTVSPHLISVKERVQIDGGVLPDDEFIHYFNEFLALVKRTGLQLMYFELMIGFAYWLFAKLKVDYAVIETGLGGLLDGSNVVSRQDKLCVLADIGLDHTKILGDTIPEIAAQKAGIIQPGNHTVAQPQSAEIISVFKRASELRQGSLELADDPAPAVSNLPSFQMRNWRLACQAYRYLQKRDGLPELTAAQYSAAAAETPPGRMESFSINGKTIILDCAHNPQKMQAFVEALADRGIKNSPVVATFVNSLDTKISGNLRPLKSLATCLLVPNFKTVQDLVRTSINAPLLAEKAVSMGINNVQVCKNVEQAIEKLLKMPGSTGVVTGSIYLAQLARPFLQQAQANNKQSTDGRLPTSDWAARLPA